MHGSYNINTNEAYHTNRINFKREVLNKCYNSNPEVYLVLSQTSTM